LDPRGLVGGSWRLFYLMIVKLSDREVVCRPAVLVAMIVSV
jgi:hypothetical protein